jgi:hypothetical protein
MSTGVRFTITDIEALPDRLDDTRYKVIDGELHVSSQPHWNQQLVSAVLITALTQWSLRAGLGVPNGAPGVIFSPEDAVAFDLIWISHARLAQGLAADGKLHAAPELVVEILSPGPADEAQALRQGGCRRVLAGRLAGAHGRGLPAGRRRPGPGRHPDRRRHAHLAAATGLRPPGRRAVAAARMRKE